MLNCCASMGGEPPKAPYGFVQYCASTMVRSNREWSSQVRNMEGCLGSPAKRLVYRSVHFLRVRVRPTTKRQISRSSGSAAFRGISPACRPAIKTCCAESPLAPSNEVTRMTGCFERAGGAQRSSSHDRAPFPLAASLGSAGAAGILVGTHGRIRADSRDSARSCRFATSSGSYLLGDRRTGTEEMERFCRPLPYHLATAP